jgi:hypothetical protein
MRMCIVEVTSKLFFRYHLLEVAVGRGHHANVNFLRSRAAQTFKFPLLQSTQEFRLDFQGNVSNLVQKQCALICQFKPPGLLHNSPSESAPFMTEQFAFKETCRNRRAV